MRTTEQRHEVASQAARLASQLRQIALEAGHVDHAPALTVEEARDRVSLARLAEAATEIENAAAELLTDTYRGADL